MLQISPNINLREEEIEFSAIRAQGSGGQNVNKVSTAIHLRFDIPNSSLPETVKTKLMLLNDHRITQDGVIVIKAQKYRSQEANKEEAIERLIELIKCAIKTQKKRRATKPTRNSQKRRMDSKTKHGKTKSLRGKVRD